MNTSTQSAKQCRLTLYIGITVAYCPDQGDNIPCAVIMNHFRNDNFDVIAGKRYSNRRIQFSVGQLKNKMKNAEMWPSEDISQ